MMQGLLRQLQLLAAAIFSVGQADPSFFPHRFLAAVQHGGGVQFIFSHHVAYTGSLLLLPGLGDQHGQALFQRV